MIEHTIYFVRHAHSVWSSDERRPLSPSGQNCAKRIAAILGQYSIDAVYSSPYQRAVETVAPLANHLHLPIHTDNRLRERHLSVKPVADFQKAVAYLWSNPYAALAGGESNAIAQKRGVEFIQSLFCQTAEEQMAPRHCVVSTHGQILALMIQHFVPDVDFDFWAQLSFPDIYVVPVRAEYANSNLTAEEIRFPPPTGMLRPVHLWSERE